MVDVQSKLYSQSRFQRFMRCVFYRACGVALATLFTALLFSATARAEIVLLDFSSPTCGPCRQMRPIMQRFIAAGYPIREVDISRDQRTASQYNVHSVPCFIMLKDGQVVDRVVGSVGQNTILAMFQKAKALGGSDRSPAGSGSRPAATPPIQPVAQPRLEQPLTAPSASLSQNSPTQGIAGSNQTLAQQLIESSVRIKVVDDGGQSYGTGTVISSQPGSAIILTCGHLFRESKGKGPVSIDLFRYTPSGPVKTTTLPGTVLSYDEEQEIGIIQIHPRNTIPSASLATNAHGVKSGDTVSSVGCNHAADPTIRDSRVTTIDRFQGPSNIEASGAPVEGRSGGGLFNERGELIGVCFAADPRANEGLYTSLPTIQSELQRNNIVLASRGGNTLVASNTPSTNAAAAAAFTGAIAPVNISPSGSTNRVPVAPAIPAIPSSTFENGANAQSSNSLAQMNAIERATLQEIAKRGAGAEVICIIRSKTPGGKNEIIRLDGASPAFVAQLTGGANPRNRLNAPQLTSHEVAVLKQPLPVTRPIARTARHMSSMQSTVKQPTTKQQPVATQPVAPRGVRWTSVKK